MSPAKVRIFRLLLASGAIVMSSVVIDGETVGVEVRSRGDGGGAKRGGGSAGTAGGHRGGGGGRPRRGGGGGAGALWGGAAVGATGWVARRGRMMFVELARAISWFCWSRTSASATVTCWPRCTTRPIDRSMPESAVTALKKLTWSSAVVKPSPGASVLKTANPIALSASEVIAPPCTVFIGL